MLEGAVKVAPPGYFGSSVVQLFGTACHRYPSPGSAKILNAGWIVLRHLASSIASQKVLQLQSFGTLAAASPFSSFFLPMIIRPLPEPAFAEEPDCSPSSPFIMP